MPSHENNKHNERHQGRLRGPVLQIRHKIALSFILLLLITSTAFWLLFQNGLNRSLQRYMDTTGATLARQTAASVRELVLTNDLLGLNVVLTQLVKDENILYAAVLDVDGNVLASAGGIPGRQTGPQHVYSAGISVQDAVAGSVRLQLNERPASAYRIPLRNLFLMVLGASLILVAATAYALGGRIAAPLQSLTGLILGSRKDGPPDSVTGRGDEVLQLEAAVDSLLARCRAAEDRLMKTHYRQNDINAPGNEPARLTASIMIVRAVNINTAIELLHPDTLANLLREYVFYLNQAVTLYGGKIYRNNGESVMACFDSAACGGDHGINAVYCAGLFQTIMQAINKTHKTRGTQTLDFRMAVHSGDIFLAPAINAAGSKEVTVDAVLGKAIDIAGFLCKKGKPGELLISESTRSQAGVFEEFTPAGQNEVTMPADNISFMAYILENGFAAGNELIRSQCEHILNIDNGK